MLFLDYRFISNGFRLLIAVSMLGIVLSRLDRNNQTGFFHQESYGLAYNHTISLGDLCNPNPFAGMAGPHANVTDHRSSSLIFAVPSKLFAGYWEIYSIQRVVMGTLYFSVLLLLILIPISLGFSLSVSLALLVYYGVSSQLLAYLFEYKLTLSSVAWLALFIFSFVKLDLQARRGNRVLSHALIIVLIVLCFASYETYCVSRPLAFAGFLMVLVWIVCRSGIQNRLWMGITYLCSLTFSVTLLKLAHPGVRFDLSLLEGRTESLANNEGAIRDGWWSIIWERVHELPVLFAWPKHSIFQAEAPSESGWLEVWLAIAVLSTTLLLVRKLSSFTPSWKYIKEHRWVLYFLITLMIVAILVPLGSTTFIRGHRLFGVYLTSTLIAAILLEALIRSDIRFVKIGLSTIAVFVAIATAVHRVPLILNVKANSTPPYFHELLAELRNAEVPVDYQPAEIGVVIRVCDHLDPPLWEHGWNAALYVSRFGCRLNGSRLEGWIRNTADCDCQPEREEGRSKLVCLQRLVEDGQVRIELDH